MKLRIVALFLLLCQVSAPAQQVHVRWLSDVTQKYGFQKFDRAQSEHDKWKSQQGVAFISANRLAVFQLNKKDATAYTLHVEILDATNGHGLKSMQLTADSEVGQVMPTYDGRFLIRAGDHFSVYSDTFEPLGSRDLPAAKDTKLKTDDWQMEVSPSGKQIILAHQQSSFAKNGDPIESKADIQVLNADTLQPTKTFSVQHLDDWSAGDGFIVTKDVNSLPSPEAKFGILDFAGKWKELTTRAEGDDPDCPYHMTAIEHQQIAAFDCDELVVVTMLGTQKFSQPLPSSEFLTSAAGADHFLAQASVDRGLQRPHITVFDLSQKAQTLWVSTEKRTVYFSVSKAGTLAVVDGDTLKFFEPVAKSDSVTADAQQGPRQRLLVDLGQKFGYQGFDRDLSLVWMKQQDVRFITPDRIAVYQVNQLKQTTLRNRDATGGGGNFLLLLEILDAKDGHEVKGLRLPTTAQFSKVIPTHDGSFIVRTGDVLYLYSAAFAQVTSRSLPLKKIDGAEGWQVDVSPSGKQVVLVHQQRPTGLAVPGPVAKAPDEADIEILDADTLETTKKFSVQYLKDDWSAADQFLVAVQPELGSSEFGALDFTGKWQKLKGPWEKFSSLCGVQMQALPQQRVAALGCRAFAVVSSSGDNPISQQLDMLEVSSTAVGNGDYVATETDSMLVGRPVSQAKPSRIDVYDIAAKSKLGSVPLNSDNPYYDISTIGELALVEGDELRIYEIRPQPPSNPANKAISEQR